MNRKNLSKCMLRTFLPSIMFFLLAGLTSCRSDDLSTGNQSWAFDTFFNFSDDTEPKTRVELVAKEELPEWLVPIVNDMEEKDPSTGVFTTNWKGRQIFNVYIFCKQNWFNDLFYSDGTPVLIEKGDEKAFFTAVWCLIYCADSVFYLRQIHKELVGKEKLPDWLIPIIDSLTTVVVNIIKAEGQQIYFVYGTIDKSVFIQGYYPDGTRCTREELSHFYGAMDWYLIYERE